MSDFEKMLGKLISVDSIKNRITIEVDFLDPEKLSYLENLLSAQDHFTFGFTKPFKTMKSRAQLAKYYVLLPKILTKLGIYPNADNIKALDDNIKDNVFTCSFLEIYDKKLPVRQSKANMSWEDMRKMIEYLYDNYGIIVNDAMEIQ
jgi:hypothetical protein